MYLRQYHDISTETIYNDIHGFIRNQNIPMNAYVQFRLALTRQNEGYHTEPDRDKQEKYRSAIEYYDHTISLDPELSVAYGNRAECWLHLKKWDAARKDFSTAINMGHDIIGSFRNDYKNAADFKDKTDIELPPDIAEMLGG